MNRFPRIYSKINWLSVIFGIVLLHFGAIANAQVGTRVALLIGNGDYQLAGMDLANPVNDINALNGSLEGLGFERRVVQDASMAEMEEALVWFERAAKNAEMAMVFYAGHGVQLDGENYLIASDLAGFSQKNMLDASMTLSQVKGVLGRAEPKIGIVVLDACRNNPFLANDWADTGLAVASGGTGLLIAYATDPGNVAYDGTGENSVFTEALLDNIATDGLDVRVMFGRVRQQVVRTTGGAQVPWVEESVLGEYYFGAPERSTPGVVDDELLYWREIADATDPAAFATYLERYPQGLFASFAQSRIDYLTNPVPYQPIEGERSSQLLLASADPDLAATSLQVLGYIPQTRGLTPVSADLLQAFDAYRATLPDPQLASIERLNTDAARLTVFLAATAGQRIRTDIAALASVERTLKVAEDAFAQLVDAAGENPDYQPLIDEARGDVDQIVAAKEQVAKRLDGSRTYYEALVLTAQDNYNTIITPELLSGASSSRSLGNVAQRLQADADLFLKHVRLATTRVRGSYIWMNDFITQN